MAQIVVCSQSALLSRNLVASLRPYGHSILEADSSIALVSACLTRHIDLAIIDSDQEFLSAPAAIRCLRCTPKTQLMPIVALTNDTGHFSEVLNAGADFALSKPVETFVLGRHVERLIAHYQTALGVPS